MKLKVLIWRTVVVLALYSGFTITGSGAEIWVSPSGQDENAGSKDAPVATLARAVELERAALAQDKTSPLTVWLNSGDYRVDPGWTLGSQDSGVESAPVVWRAVEPGKARLLGDRSILPELWKPLDDSALLARLAPEAKGHVQQLDLVAAGFHLVTTLPDYSRNPALNLQLYNSDASLPLSRWPNGAYGYTTVDHVLDNGGGSSSSTRGGVFVYRGDEPERWLAALDDGGVWLRGFWRVPWEAGTLRVKTIDPVAKTISFATSIPGGIGSKYSKVENGIRVGTGKENWFASNLLEEIDTPGEWSIDFKRGRLYLWPPDKGPIAISDNSTPLVTFSGASHVEFHNLVLGWNAGDGVKIDGGDHIRLIGCSVRQVAQHGVLITGGVGHALLGNDITDVGLSAIDVSGGDRATLTPSGDEICNNLISRVALNSPVPAVVAGIDAHHQNVIGVCFAHNRIDGASCGGGSFAGNDNIFEYNEICRIGLDGGDLGAFYTTGGWTSRGNVVRYNFIHDSPTANGIYMDDGDSGLEAYSNLIDKVSSGLFIGGGHDNYLHDNLMVECERAIHVDDRGVSRKYSVSDSRLRGDYDSVPVQSAAWAKYPGLVALLQTDTRIPSGNILENNIAVACGILARKSGTSENLAGYAFKNNGELATTAVFVAPQNLDFHLKDPISLTKLVSGFPPIPVEKIGLQVDANRAVIPPEEKSAAETTDGKRPVFDSQQDVDSSRKTP